MELKIAKPGSRPPRRRRPTRAKVFVGGASERYYSRTIGRAFDVLDSFVDDHTVLNLKEIGQLTQLPDASLFRILVTLETRGCLLQNADGSYQLTPKILLGKLHERANRTSSLKP